MPSLLEQIQTSVEYSEFGLTLHAQQQITTRQIKVAEIRGAILSDDAEVIEDYPEDPRGASCLLYGVAANKMLHIHISYPSEIVIITAYQPDLARWMPDLKRRK